jgi:single-strand DNA-binding protein
MLYQGVAIGSLAAKPELKIIPGKNGKEDSQVANLRLAVNRQYSSNGERTTETTWWNIAVWGPQAKACSDWLDKGSLVAVTMDRSPVAESYLTSDGQPGASLKATASNVKFLSGNKRNDSGNSGSGNTDRNEPPAGLDDIPF